MAGHGARLVRSLAWTACLALAGTGAARAESASEDGLPSLGSHAGRVVLVHFWATWCDPCTRELPSLVAFHREVYPGLREKGLTLLTVSNDVRESDLRDFLEEHALPFPVYFDPYATLRDRLAILGVPGTAILGRDGHVVDRLFGEQDWQSPALRERFEKYVEE